MGRPGMLMCLLLWLFMVGGVWGEVIPRRHQVFRYSEREGMPSAQVLGMTALADGCLVVVTRRGAARFDGFSWDDLHLEKVMDVGRLQQVRMRTGLGGRLWLLIQDGGGLLGLYSYDEGKWQVWDVPRGEELGQLSGLELGADGVGGEVLWFSCTARGVFSFEKGVWRSWSWQDGLRSNHIGSLVVRANGAVAAGHALGVDVLEPGGRGRRRWNPMELPGSGGVLALAEGNQPDGSGTSLWALGQGGWAGNMDEQGNWRHWNVSLGHTGPGTLWRACPDTVGGLYLGHEKGLYYLSAARAEGGMRVEQGDMSVSGILDMCCDREGTFWAANRQGLTKIPYPMMSQEDRQTGLCEHEVSCVVALGQDRLALL